MTKINSDTICSVTTYDKVVDDSFKWRKGLNSRWCNIKEGYYTPLDPNVWTKETLIEGGRLVENNVVYERPSVVVKLSSGERYTKRFDTLQEAETYAEDLTRYGRYIKII